MNYETFKSSAVSSIQSYFGENATVTLHSITKNNNIQLDGLMIQSSSLNISPTIYLNYYYEDYLAGKSLSSVFDEIISSYQEHLPPENMDLSFFTDYHKAKYHIIYKLINYSQNAELLTDVPHFRFLDLAVVFCCYLTDDVSGTCGNATILIHNHHLSFWNITADLLYELAIKNTPILLPYDLKSMEDVLQSLCPDFNVSKNNTDYCTDESNETPPMYVLTNTEKLYGASAILYPDILASFAELIDSDLYILPSSIHEVLLLPKHKITNPSELDNIIREVNTSQVLKEDILSDHAYRFERASGFITR